MGVPLSSGFCFHHPFAWGVVLADVISLSQHDLLNTLQQASLSKRVIGRCLLFSLNLLSDLTLYPA